MFPSSSSSRPTRILSEAQLLNRAGGKSNFRPGKGGAAGGDDKRKVGSGWNSLPTSRVPSSSHLNGINSVQKDKIEIDDYEEDDEPKINPQRITSAKSQPLRKPSSTASRWAAIAPAQPPATTTTTTTTVEAPPPAPSTSSSSSSPAHANPYPKVISASYGSFPTSLPPSPSSEAPSPLTSTQTQTNGPPRPTHNLSRTPSSASASRQPLGPPSPSTSQSGTPRNISRAIPKTGRTGGPGGGSGTSRWANNNTSSSSTPQPRRDNPTPKHPLPAKPTSPVQSVKVNGHPPPPTGPRAQTYSETNRSSNPPQGQTQVKPTLPPPIPLVSTSSVPSPTPAPHPTQPSPTQSSHPTRIPSPSAPSNPKPNPPRPSQVSPTRSNLPPPPPTPTKQPNANTAANNVAAAQVARGLLPDRNRVSSGGARKEKKSPEELEALMAKMRLKNQEAMNKRAKAEEDRKKFEEIAEMERKRTEELERKLREERERVVREEKERKERTIELQKEINRAREEAAQRKLALIQGRAWDAEKLERERDPIGEGGSGRELQYPSHERKLNRQEQDEPEDDEDEEVEMLRRQEERLSEEERRRRDGVRNDEQAWETVQHFEGKGRAQLIVK